jgi:hypothetical protein
VLTAGYLNRHQLVGYARQAAARGEIHIAATRPKWSDEQQQWQLPVYRVREVDRPRMSRAKWTGLAVALPLAALAGLVWWVLATLTAGALLALCVGALLTMILVVRAGRPSVTVTTTTTTQVR